MTHFSVIKQVKHVSEQIRNAKQVLKSEYGKVSKPWLILGKGPSLSKLNDFDTSGYNIAGLNHVVSKHSVDLAHAVDIEVVEECGDHFIENCKFLAMPWYPHRKSRVGSKNLEVLAVENEVLSRLRSEGRLLYYDLCTANCKKDDSDPVIVRYFSSEALIELIAKSGCKKIRTLGVDGGSKYSTEFDNLANRTRLANGVASFDAQFVEFPKLIRKYELDLGPLDSECPIPIFVGASKNEWLSTRVLEYSIKKHSSIDINLIPLCKVDRPFPLPEKKECQPRTPFSFHRLLIPELKNYTGRAFYLDSDMLVLKDIRKLWLNVTPEAEIDCVIEKTDEQKNSGFSVMILNCEKLDWKIEKVVEDLDADKYTYEDLMHRMVIASEISDSIPSEWNTLDSCNKGITGLVHYTNMSTQPWLKAGHPHGDVWMNYLKEAIEEGFIVAQDVVQQVEMGNVRPSLLVDVGLKDGADDSSFVPPYMKTSSLAVASSDSSADDREPPSIKERITSFFLR